MPTYFTIASRMNDLVLDIKAHDISPGTPVITYPETGADNQLWYHDIYAGVIRSKANHDYVLDIVDGDLVINPYDPDNHSQKFGCGSEHVHRLDDDGQVLDIANADSSECARVCLWNDNGGENQRWGFNHKEHEYFLIKSDMNGQVLDISGGESGAGAQVIVWDESGADNQLWYEDEHNVIRSKLNGLVPDACSGDITMQPFNKDSHTQGFSFLDNKIVNLNNPDECLDVKGGDHDAGTPICMWEYKASDNQHWSRQNV